MQTKNKINDKQAIMELVKSYTENYYNNRGFEPNKTAIPPSGKLIDYKEICNIVDLL